MQPNEYENGAAEFLQAARRGAAGKSELRTSIPGPLHLVDLRAPAALAASLRLRQGSLARPCRYPKKRRATRPYFGLWRVVLHTGIAILVNRLHLIFRRYFSS